jgi:hypothetical protein
MYQPSLPVTTIIPFATAIQINPSSRVNSKLSGKKPSVTKSDGSDRTLFDASEPFLFFYFSL